MRRELLRTGATALTNAEMIILDMAATSGGCRRMYYPDVFSQTFNYPTHGLSPQELHETLDQFESRGLITGRETVDWMGKTDKEVAVTPEGGKLWEEERLPDWSRYLDGRYRGRDDGQRVRFSIYGHSPQICDAYFAAACDSGILDFRGGRVRTARGNRQLVWWRPIETVYLLSVEIHSFECRADWSHLEMKRCWWFGPAEISKLWGWPSAQ